MDGQKGRDGVDGLDGRDGQPGTVGPQGPQGPKGDAGTNGTNGQDHNSSMFEMRCSRYWMERTSFWESYEILILVEGSYDPLYRKTARNGVPPTRESIFF